MSLEKRLRKVFQTPRKGETFELRSGLVSQYAHERKDAIQRTIAAMTLGKDVSSLFPDILKNLATHDLDQKKLVYLYLMNYAKSHPELCILAVNTFVQDSEDPNPLVRALAIRTMGCIRVDKMVDYLSIPLRKTLRDDNPYVRKTAAICVAKLFDLNPNMAIEEGFLTDLQSLVDDSNPMVVANAVSALSEIQESAPEVKTFEISPVTLNKLLVALNECTEWGRIAILTALSQYETSDVKEAEHICERVVPQFQHANPSVVLASIKAVITHLPIQSTNAQNVLLRKMSSPLVTLVSCAPEVQYVALRNIRIILQKYPQILSRELRVFFCRYNDPLYLKFEKLEIMVSLANSQNVDQLLAELKEYSMEVDMEFVRRAIKAIGQCAVKIESAAEKAVNVLLDLLDDNNKTNNYVIQEVVIEIRDILRRYKNAFEGAIPVLCQNIDDIEEPEARAAMIWILGEYAHKIDNAGTILENYVSTFLEEATQVQLQLLTACVKLYIKKPNSGNNLIHSILQDATTKSDNADIRDRAYIYWRLLSSDASVSKDVVLADKPPIKTTIETIPPTILDELLAELSTLASVYHKPASSFMGTGQFGSDEVQKRAIEEQRQLAKEDAISNIDSQTVVNGENLLDLDFDAPASDAASTGSGANSGALGDLGDIFSNSPSPTISSPAIGATATKTNGNQDILSLFGSTSTPVPAAPASSSLNQLTDGFGGLNLQSQTQSQPTTQASSQTQSKSTNEDLLGLF
ncbi:Apl2p [Sugiyamaella lignohabitans]|uniref:AP complex subunit beta n=1 Tax=Sugiyamaella lignohabitans TaxID=796027 RepID=A0A167CTE1_9ASCO|nr:Apl2p [Sugiyamaella lignohabitans]ANB12084.1 Apl2p [Sugiyamaella lignohabitans]